MSRLTDLDAACSEVLRRSLSEGLKASLRAALARGCTIREVLAGVERAGAPRNSLTWLACAYELQHQLATQGAARPTAPAAAPDAPPAGGPSPAGG